MFCVHDKFLVYPGDKIAMKNNRWWFPRLVRAKGTGTFGYNGTCYGDELYRCSIVTMRYHPDLAEFTITEIKRTPLSD